PLDIRGISNLPDEHPYLLCPNHASLMDPIIVVASLPTKHLDRLVFLGAEQFFTSRLMRRLARIGRVIPTASSDTVLLSLQRAAEAVSLGYSVCIFPEGFVTRDGYLQRPRPGMGILSWELDLPIVPVLLRGTFSVMSYTHPAFRFRPIGITVGRPIVPERKESDESGDYSDRLQQWHRAVSRLRAEDDASDSRTAGLSPRIRKERSADE
ncbi:lysophospholipid acyltransferase family protein, partial [Acidobacteriota bacterium]